MKYNNNEVVTFGTHIFSGTYNLVLLGQCGERCVFTILMYIRPFFFVFMQIFHIFEKVYSKI